jgi:hypothetical protein
MAFVTLPGHGSLAYPAMPPGPVAGAIALNNTSLIIDAAGERIALMGQYWSASGGSKTIDTISFMPGTMVNTNGSNIRVSLQNLNTAATPTQPDGTQDQFRDHLINTISSNTWFTTGLVTNDGTNGGIKRTVNHGDFLAVVIEFQSFVAGDILRAQGSGTAAHIFGPVAALFAAAAWTIPSVLPNVLFTNSDGSLGCFHNAPPRTAQTNVPYNNGTTPDEYGVRFTAPFDMKVDGISFYTFMPNSTADFELVLYQDTTVIDTIVVPAEISSTTGTARISELSFATKRTLVKDVQYIISMKPTTANDVSTFFYNVAAASHIGLWAGGVGTELVVRTDLGAWAVDGTPTRRWYHLGVMITDIDIPTAGGGGTGRPMISVLC